MNNYSRELRLGLALAGLFAALLGWFIFSKPHTPLQILIALLILVIGSVTFVWRVVRKKKDIATNAPSEDEFTRLARVYAGSQAFEFSMFLWLLIFIFHSSFNKVETMLGVGILGSALIYGICLWYYRRTGAFNVDQD